jgi:hypothetical protein
MRIDRASTATLGASTRLLKALADPARLRLLNLLAGGREVCVCHLHEALELPQPMVSRHLAYLRKSGLVRRVSGGGSGRSLFIWNLLFRERTPMAPTAAEVAEESAPAPGLPMPEAPRAAVAKPHSSTRSPVLWPASHHGNAVRVDRLMTGVLELCLVITVVPLFLILGYLIYRGVGALNWNFFVKLPAPVGQAGGGMANALYGSLLLVGLATLFAVPVGLFAAIYLAEYRSVRLGPAVRFIGELLGGVPSIVIGIFAYAVVVKPMGHFSGWAGGFALGVMMIPIFMRVAEEALSSRFVDLEVDRERPGG